MSRTRLIRAAIVVTPATSGRGVVERLPEILFQGSDADFQSRVGSNEFLDVGEAEAFVDQNGQSRLHFIHTAANSTRKTLVLSAREFLCRLDQFLQFYVHAFHLSIRDKADHNRQNIHSSARITQHASAIPTIVGRKWFIFTARAV